MRTSQLILRNPFIYEHTQPFYLNKRRIKYQVPDEQNNLNGLN